jgi:hypothetical protein
MSNRLVPSRADLSPSDRDRKGVTGQMCDQNADQDATKGLERLVLSEPPEVIAERRRRVEEQLDAKGIKPMTLERLREVATGKDLVSDEEFEEYLAFIDEQRGR